jgi:uncharacterized membrane protein
LGADPNFGNVQRQTYLDRVRGLAVLVMIEAHVFDAWTRASDRHTHAYANAMILGGFGAPLFLFLAGLTFVLQAESRYRKRGDFDNAWRGVRQRGWKIFGLAFLFRLQAFILTGGYSPIGLLKVDILNVMGPAIVAMGVMGGLVKARKMRAAAFASAAAAFAMLAPVVRNAQWLSLLPDPVEWYLVPNPIHSNFTIFPWAGFVFAGALTGLATDWLWQTGQRARLQVGLAVVGTLIAVIAYEASKLPSIYAKSEFWTTSPTFFFLRIGVMLLLIPAAFCWDRSPWRGLITRWSPLEEFGRASLFVYWIHVEMVYGVISKPIRQSLSFQTVVVADLVFSVFLLLLVLLKNRVFTIGPLDPIRTSSPTPASI